MRITTQVTCPYCGFVNCFGAEDTIGDSLVRCNVDMGGCDGAFVVSYVAKLETSVKSVEGEERYHQKWLSEQNRGTEDETA